MASRAVEISFGLLGLGLSAANLVVMIGIAATAALGPQDVEILFFPAAIGLAGLVLTYWGFKSRLSRRGLLLILLVPGALALFACIPAIAVLTEPLYHPPRTRSFEVEWKIDQLSNRVAFQPSPRQNYWLTLKEQPGLIEHLQGLKKQRVSLALKALFDKDGSVTRFKPIEIEGFTLKRQYLLGHYYPDAPNTMLTSAPLRIRKTNQAPSRR